MDPGVVMAAVVAAGITMSLRLVPSVLIPRTASDAGYHLLLRREIRAAGFRVPARVGALALDRRQTYPWLFHWLIALLPERTLKAAPGLPTALIDAALVVLTMVMTLQVAPESAVTAGVAGLLVGTSPALLAVGIGPRAYEITPRPLGELWWAVAMTAALWGTSGHSIGWVLAAGALGLGLLSSKFVAQVALFCLPLMALATGRLGFLALAPASVVAALVLSGGKYWWILTGQLVHLKLYRARLQYEHPSLGRSTELGPLFAATRAALASRLRDRQRNRTAAQLLENHPVLQFLLRNITLVLLAALLVGVWPALRGAPYAGALLAWTLAPIAPFVLTLLPGWRFLGEAERYLEYAAVPAAILLALTLPLAGARAAVGAVVIYVMVLAVVYGYGLVRRRMSGGSEPVGETDALVRYLSTLPEGTRLLTIPWTTLSFALAYRVKLPFVCTIDPTVWAEAYDRLFQRYPWPTTDLAWWHREHGATHVVVSRHQLQSSATADRVYPLGDHVCVYESAAFAVYSLALPSAASYVQKEVLRG